MQTCKKRLSFPKRPGCNREWERVELKPEGLHLFTEKENEYGGKCGFWEQPAFNHIFRKTASRGGIQSHTRFHLQGPGCTSCHGVERTLSSGNICQTLPSTCEAKRQELITFNILSSNLTEPLRRYFLCLDGRTQSICNGAKS